MMRLHLPKEPEHGHVSRTRSSNAFYRPPSSVLIITETKCKRRINRLLYGMKHKLDRMQPFFDGEQEIGQFGRIDEGGSQNNHEKAMDPINP